MFCTFLPIRNVQVIELQLIIKQLNKYAGIFLLQIQLLKCKTQAMNIKAVTGTFVMSEYAQL